MSALKIVLFAASTGSASDIYNKQKNNQWFKDGVEFIKHSINVKIINKKAKNVILFVGDGMGVSTVTAARILDGQNKGNTGIKLSKTLPIFNFTVKVYIYISLDSVL